MQERRSKRAIILVLFFCCACGGALRASGDEAGLLLAGAADAETVARSVMDGATAADAMRGIGYEAQEAAALPAWFVEEVLDASCVDEWFADEGMEAMFVTFSGATEMGRAEVRQMLLGRGWSVVTDDEAGMLSLVKEEGTCTWLTVNVREVGGVQDAILRIQRTSPEKDEQRRTGGGS